jgi:hypothetical protein
LYRFGVHALYHSDNRYEAQYGQENHGQATKIPDWLFDMGQAITAIGNLRLYLMYDFITSASEAEFEGMGVIWGRWYRAANANTRPREGERTGVDLDFCPSRSVWRG